MVPSSSSWPPFRAAAASPAAPTTLLSTAASTESSAPSGGHETEYKLSPNTISLTKPGTYVFKGVNDGTTAHALAVEGNGLDQEISAINPGSSGTVKVTLPKAGTYDIYCPIDGHKGLGVKGTITVGGTGATGGGTSTENMNTGTTEPTIAYSTGY